MTTLMEGLTQAGGHPLARAMLHALGWTLLHFCWQGAIVAGLLWCVLAILGHRSSEARYGAACSALMLTVAASLTTLARLASAEYQLVQKHAGVPVVDPGMVLWVDVRFADHLWPMRVVTTLDHWVPSILLFWFAGVSLYVVRLNAGLVVAHHLKSRQTHAVAEDLRRLFDDLRCRLGIPQAVSLMHSARVQVPTVIGWMRPVVLIPVSCLTGLSMEQVEAIFAHELAHVRRHDYLVSVFQSVVEALLFYHPAVWWISKQVRRERECCCDEIAIAACGNVLEYARALSYLEEQRATVPEFVLGANGGVLTMRIKRLLNNKDQVAGSSVAALAALALMVVAAGSYFAVVARAEATAASPASVSATQLDAKPASLQTAAPISVELIPLATASPKGGELRAGMSPPDGTAEGQTAARQGPLQVSAGVIAGNMISTVNPLYPPGARAAHVQGIVVLHAVISKTGEIEKLQVVSGPPLLTSSAMDAVRRWTYKPYLLNGEPVEVESTINVNYTIAPATPPSQDGAANPPQSGPGSQLSPNSPVRVSGGVSASMLVAKVNPVYPQAAKEAQISGIVILKAVIGKSGTIEDLQVVSGPPELTQSALDAVQQWTYKPYLLNGEPTAVQTTITVNYSLAGDRNAENDRPTTQQDYQDEPLRRIGGSVNAPRLISQKEPEYSEEARKKKLEGVVLVSLVVDREGNPQKVRVLRGVGMGLDEKAVEAVQTYRFKPAMENGQPVPVQLNIEVNFKRF